MSDQGFNPLSSQLGIAGTSYRIQLGLINDKWASRLLKGNTVIDSYVYKDEDVESGFPNQNLIVGWVIRTVAIPNINPHQIMKTTQALVKQALEKKEQKKTMAPIAETREVELEKVPTNELKRPKVTGWVRQEGEKTVQEREDETRKAFQARVAAKQEEEKEKVERAPTIHTSRQLPSIPSEGTIPSEGKASVSESSKFCPSCGKDLDFKYCPYCGEPLPHK